MTRRSKQKQKSMKWLVWSAVILSIALLVSLVEKNLGLVSGAEVALSAIKVLYRMDKSDFQAFIESYEVFERPQQNDEDEDKVNAYYRVLMPLLELGGLRKFYIPPLMDESKASFRHIQLQQELFERKMADALSLGPGQVALDVGCGQGLIADLVQEHTGAKVVGMNISPEQIEKAKNFAQKKGKLGTLLEFDIGSMNDDPFPYEDASFDAVYAVQTLCYAHNLTNTMREIRRVLKPGGMFSSLDVVSMERYNPNNQTQNQMAQRAKRVGGIPIWRSLKEHETSYVTNGFILKVSQHLSHAGLMQAAKDFFNPLGDVLKLLRKVGLISQPMIDSVDTMNAYATDLIEGDRERLFTTDWWTLAQG